ncbi:hypothetical protein GRI01_02215 [Lactobacillus gasseri]|nr:hypothetical protein [Lactobacillus gasseri]
MDFCSSILNSASYSDFGGRSDVNMEQISENTYFLNPEKWQNIANIIGGLEICDSETGWPIGVLKPVGIEYYEDSDD